MTYFRLSFMRFVWISYIFIWILGFLNSKAILRFYSFSTFRLSTDWNLFRVETSFYSTRSLSWILLRNLFGIIWFYGWGQYWQFAFDIFNDSFFIRSRRDRVLIQIRMRVTESFGLLLLMTCLREVIIIVKSTFLLVTHNSGVRLDKLLPL